MTDTNTDAVTANADLVRSMVALFLSGDLAGVQSHFAPDACGQLPGRGRLAGVYHGPEEIIGFLASSFELSGGTLSLDLMDVMASENGAAHLQRVTAAHDGRQLDCVEVLVHRIENGAIVHTHHRPDQHAIDAFFG